MSAKDKPKTRARVTTGVAYLVSRKTRARVTTELWSTARQGGVTTDVGDDEAGASAYFAECNVEKKSVDCVLNVTSVSVERNAFY